MKNRFTILIPAPVISLVGSEGLDLLQRIGTNDLSSLAVGKSRETAFLTEKGRIVAVATVTRQTEASLLISGSSVGGPTLQEWIQKFIIMEDIQSNDLSSNYLRVLLYDLEVDSVERISSVLPSDATLSEGYHGSGEIYQIHSPIGTEEDVCNLLRNNGFVSETADLFEEFRIISGIAGAPFEISVSFNPLEANLMNLISWTKGCYVGQEVVARLETYKKVQRMITRLEFAELPGALPAVITSGDDDIGLITSATQRRIEGRFHALGYVRKNVESTGLKWSFKGSDGQDVSVSPARQVDSSG